MWADEKVEQVIEGSDSEESDLNVSTLEKQLDQLAHETSFREARETFSSMKQSSEENTTTYFLRIIYGYIIMEGRSKLMAKRKGVKVSKLYAGGEVVDATMKLSASEEPISKSGMSTEDAACRYCNMNSRFEKDFIKKEKLTNSGSEHLLRERSTGFNRILPTNHWVYIGYTKSIKHIREIPSELLCGNTSFMPKKEESSEMGDVIPIKVLPHVIWVLCKVIGNRLKQVPFDECQKGFREVNGCSENS
ncbi:unnamed protein product [Lepeophtheirus salmonis]|uniref:(salmon louse) hypothetical protein n=1 Tax=Lepeophtheirus salmonis TaxID=72036 RepID=A0A7R8CFA8_LEPSM|nr:unnamed protein product [Lepeophtheirus salmonis]CAF2804673.1 unnamed protein product [Lepeophtheirus salmonis]